MRIIILTGVEDRNPRNCQPVHRDLQKYFAGHNHWPVRYLECGQELRYGQQLGLEWEGYAFVALVFWIFCFSMSRYSQWLERRWIPGIVVDVVDDRRGQTDTVMT